MKLRALAYRQAGIPSGRDTASLPGKVISFYIVPLDPALKAGLAGHVPANSLDNLG
jgi:hypothetical protein